MSHKSESNYVLTFLSLAEEGPGTASSRIRDSRRPKRRGMRRAPDRRQVRFTHLKIKIFKYLNFENPVYDFIDSRLL